MANNKLQKTFIPASFEQDWTDQPGKERLSRVNRIFTNNDTRQTLLIQNIKNMPKEIPTPNVSTVYGLKQRVWQFVGYKCLDCGKTMAKEDTKDKHPLVCDFKIKINKEQLQKQEEEFMPIQRVEKDGETYYRYGTHGKLYKNRADAEKQAQAIHASGYQEPTVSKGRPQMSPKVNK